jgi:polyisoprenoid-binding protein YceI
MKTLIIAPLLLAAYLTGGPDEATTTAPRGLMALSLDPTHSSSIFRIKHAGCTWFYGRFDSPSGSVVYDPENGELDSLEIIIQVANVNTGARGRNDHLKRADFFDGANFPEISFKSTSVAAGSAENNYAVTGDLTMRGVTKSIIIPVEYTGQGSFRGGPRYGFASQFTINRSEWGVSFGIGTMLDDEVQLTFGLETRQGE